MNAEPVVIYSHRIDPLGVLQLLRAVSTAVRAAKLPWRRLEAPG